MGDPAPVGVRPVVRETGIRDARMRWVRSGPFELSFGDRVAVRDGDDEWLGEVVLPSARLVEWPALEDLPEVSRRVPDVEWPNPPPAAGRQVLEALALPPELLAWRWPGAGTEGAASASSGPSIGGDDGLAGAGGAAQDERAGQEPGGEHSQHR